jgi:hypothetical protein
MEIKDGQTIASNAKKQRLVVGMESKASIIHSATISVKDAEYIPVQ